MNVKRATAEYEAWLKAYTPLVSDDMKKKHDLMRSGLFPFLRATFYRWCQLLPKVCPELESAPIVLAVGDLHIENFGTWRDAEGRLAWGVNDFDEAEFMPFSNDLIRLAASVLISAENSAGQLEPAAACAEILKGYSSCLSQAGRPFVLAEEHAWLRDIAIHCLGEPAHFWAKMDDLADAEKVPETARVAIQHRLPQRETPIKLKRRTAGMGSLGHPRYVALAEWVGGRVAREAKALVPSAYRWASAGTDGYHEIYYQAIIDGAKRCPDPFTSLQGHWIVRRLAPDCTRVELDALPERRTQLALLYAMGWETANIHLGTPGARTNIRRDLKARKQGWLLAASRAMVEATRTDWDRWRAS